MKKLLTFIWLSGVTIAIAITTLLFNAEQNVEISTEEYKDVYVNVNRFPELKEDVKRCMKDGKIVVWELQEFKKNLAELQKFYEKRAVAETVLDKAEKQ